MTRTTKPCTRLSMNQQACRWAQNHSLYLYFVLNKSLFKPNQVQNELIIISHAYCLAFIGHFRTSSCHQQSSRQPHQPGRCSFLPVNTNYSSASSTILSVLTNLTIKLGRFFATRKWPLCHPAATHQTRHQRPRLFPDCHWQFVTVTNELGRFLALTSSKTNLQQEWLPAF